MLMSIRDAGFRRSRALDIHWFQQPRAEPHADYPSTPTRSRDIGDLKRFSLAVISERPIRRREPTQSSVGKGCIGDDATSARERPDGDLNIAYFQTA